MSMRAANRFNLHSQGSMLPVTVLIAVIFSGLHFAPVSLGGCRTVSAQTQALVQQFAADESSLKFKYRNPNSTVANKRMHDFYSVWTTRLSLVDFEKLSSDAQIDTILLRNYVSQKSDQLAIKMQKDRIAVQLVEFIKPVNEMLDQYEKTRAMEPETVATIFQTALGEIQKGEPTLVAVFAKSRKTVLIRAIKQIDSTLANLDEFHRFNLKYDPLYTWWVEKPYEALVKAMKSYAEGLRIKVFGTAKPTDQIVGEPIGRAELDKQLKYAFIPYSAEELIDLANQEMVWCENEMRKASRELGFGSWQEAQNHVKKQFVKPGEQPKLIQELAQEAVNFLEMHNLITVPAIAKETWRMRMMSPERQKMSPYFLGGHTILVAYPTGGMSHPDKLMSMRGNNRHFARATVHHELIPGHHLQYFMNKRNKSYRALFNTPFWLEGWAVYWEMLLWDLGFAKSAEDKIGMLFWRKHRCARIIFSLGYHSGELPPDECIDYLVNRVGHERNNATAEVRRSIMGGYGPLYQAAYMVGAMQFRKLHEELVQSGKMTNREFHDAVLKENNIPVELLRAKLLEIPIKSDFKSTWRFKDR